MKKDDNVYLEHILQSVIRIAEYIDGKSKDDFLKNLLLQDAVVRQIEIIGEATKNISKELRNDTNDIPWADMAGMRDVIIHQYFSVDLELVYETAVERVPALKIKIEKLLSNQ